MDERRSCTVFRGSTRIASGALAEVALAAKAELDADETAQILIFDDATAEPIDLDFRGAPDDVLRRLGQAPEARPDATGQATGAARRGPGPSQARSGGPRGYPAPAALGLARPATGRRVRCSAQTGRGGEARKWRQGSYSPVTRGGLPLHACHGGERSRVRGSGQGALRRRRGPLPAAGRGLAPRHLRSRQEPGRPSLRGQTRRPQAMKLGLRKPCSVLP